MSTWLMDDPKVKLIMSSYLETTDLTDVLHVLGISSFQLRYETCSVLFQSYFEYLIQK